MPYNRFSKLPRRLTFERILSGYNGLTNPWYTRAANHTHGNAQKRGLREWV